MNLTNIAIPDGIAEMGVGVFIECQNLTAFEGKFASADGRCIVMDGVLKSFAPHELSAYTVPDGVAVIGSGVFFNCSLLESVVLPEDVTVIEESAFLDCMHLSSISLPAGVTSIGNFAFSGCSNLTSITIPDGVTEINHHAFADCMRLSSVTLPVGVTSIGEFAFIGCPKLVELYCKPTNPPAVDLTAFDILVCVPSSLQVYVPTASVDVYKAAYPWSELAGQIMGYDF